MRRRLRPIAIGLEARVRERTAEREDATARLAENQARLSAIVDSAMDAVITVGTDQRIVVWNAAAEAMFRCPAAEALGQPLDRFVPAAARVPHRGHVEAFAAGGRTARRMGHPGTVWGQRADGDQFPVEASISHATVGTATLLTAILRDVTERRRAEEAHRLFSERLQVLHEIDRSILSADSGPRTAQAALDRIRVLLGSARAAIAEHDLVRGTGRWLAVSGASGPATAEGQAFPLALMGAVESLRAGRVETIAVASVAQHAAGREAAALGVRAYTVVPLIAEGQLIGSVDVACPDGRALDEGALGIVREVADQLAIALRHSRLREQILSHAADLERDVEQRTRELAAANAELSLANDKLRDMLAELEAARREQIETKDRFLSHVSHELRAPLTAIYQFSTILQDGLAGALSADQAECVDVLVRNAGQLRSMIDDLLEATRADMAILTLRRRPGVAVDALVDDVLQTLRPAAAEKGVALVHELPADLPRVHADPARVRQILVNLVDNAIKFSGAGRAVRVSAGGGAATPEFVRVSVTDEGPGLTSAEQQQVFSRLYQAPHTAHTARNGLGLGLYISKELVQRHGGSIWVDGETGRGSTVSFTLPADRRTRAAVQPDHTSTAAGVLT
jgi:PAS domain S-box-containing protein